MEYQGAKSKRYGVFYIGSRKSIGAHRYAWSLANGPIPDGMFVCHKCDNPPCCNPDHLFIGTHDDNMRDMAKKGRGRSGVIGATSFLTVDQVASIRADSRSLKEIAADYGIDFRKVSDIKAGLIKRHMPGPIRRTAKAKLNEGQVRAIRVDARPCTVIGPEYGISAMQVRRIILRQKWASIPD